MFEGFIRNEVFGYFFIGIIIFVIFYAFIITIINEYDILTKIGNYFNKVKTNYQKRKQEKILSFNPFILLFGGLAVFIFIITERISNWFKRNKNRIIFTFINILILLPIVFNLIGIIDTLPEPYFSLLLIYGMIAIILVLGRSEQRRTSGHYHNDNINYNNRHQTERDYGYGNSSTYKSNYTSKYNRGMGGLTKEEVNKKKKKIRENLTNITELRKKYNL